MFTAASIVAQMEQPTPQNVATSHHGPKDVMVERVNTSTRKSGDVEHNKIDSSTSQNGELTRGFTARHIHVKPFFPSSVISSPPNSVDKEKDHLSRF